MQPTGRFSGFRDPRLAGKLVDRINLAASGQARLMEFCGSHTAAILKFGLRQLLPPGVEMLSGPGCPVCVTDQADIDMAIAMARLPDVIMCTFGDMLKVPGSNGSLAEARALDCDVRTVYSTLDALEIARQNPSRKVIFLGVGFETTAPTIAASIVQAKNQNISNYRVLSLAKVCPPVMKALLDAGEINIDGIICPGHVSAIIGSKPYEFIPADYGIGCVVAGFEPVDILLAVELLLNQIRSKAPKVEIAYGRGVEREGNCVAERLLAEVFEPVSASWRGVGEVAASGLAISDNYRDFDAMQYSGCLDMVKAKRLKTGCRCGDVLRGSITPHECRLFKVECTPENPVGPCMVSAEGACSSYFLYGDEYGK